MTREKRLRLINENMELFGPLPDDYEDFVNSSVFKLDNIIIYSTKDNEAYCTGCKQTTHDLKLFNKTPKHNQSSICPCCGRLSVAKSKGLIKNGFDVIRWSVFVDHNDEDVLIRYIRHYRHYKSNGDYTQISTEMYRTVITSIGNKYFGNYYSGWSFYRRPYNPWGEPSEFNAPREYVMLYNMDIDKDLKGTVCQYSACNIVARENELPMHEDCLLIDKHIRQKNVYKIENYLCQYVDKSYLEQLVKLKYFNLLSCAMEDEDYSSFNAIPFYPGKRKINETLGLTRSEYLQLTTTISPTPADVKILLKLREHNMHVSNETYCELRNNSGNSIDVSDFAIARKYMSETKAIKMLRQNGHRYTDYLDMANKLGWDMKSSMILFPKDVTKAHDIAVEQFNKVKQKNIRALLKKAIESHMYDYENKSLTIVVPKSGAQIVKEGQKLHHCVARYVDAVGKGETMILFVRYKDKPNVPFYTLEWKDNEIKQCYGLKDCETTPEVQKFINQFAKKMLVKIKKTA